MESNSGRAGLWHVQGGNPLAAAVYVSDGFMVNLGVVMLQLAQPFTQDLNTAKFLKVRELPLFVIFKMLFVLPPYNYLVCRSEVFIV